MKRRVLILCFLFILVSSCKKKSINCDLECNSTEELLFQTGFEGTSISAENEYNKAQFSGNDISLDSISDWQTLMTHSNIGNIDINYEEGEPSQRIATIVDDPLNSGNAVLKFQIWESHIKEASSQKGRVNTLAIENNCLKEIYQKVKVYLHPDMEHLTNWSEKITWLTLFEFWNNSQIHNEKKRFRVTVGLGKEEGIGKPLHFHVNGDRLKGGKWKSEWTKTDSQLEFPFGTWFEVELYILEGGKNNGRFYMAITPDGGIKQVLFDVINYTQHPKERCPDGFTDFNPQKLYTGQTLIDYMKNSDKNLAIYWDDWKLYKNKKP